MDTICWGGGCMAIIVGLAGLIVGLAGIGIDAMRGCMATMVGLAGLILGLAGLIWGELGMYEDPRL
jgi:hypothetical protein